MTLSLNETHLMNCVDGMNFMLAESVDLCITSPPYDDLRTYNDSSQWDFNVFKDVAACLVRVLKPGGVIMWNVNDATVKGSETGSSFRQCLHFMDAHGMRLHDTMIYEKTGTAFASGPKSVRYTQIFEYCFILSKGKPKTINLIQDKKNKWAGYTSFGNAVTRKKDGTFNDPGKKSNAIREYGVRTNIWKIKNSGGFGQSSKVSYKHPATMPEELARAHIQTWSNKGDLVIDPFMGAGTTAQMCVEEGRNFIGFEIDTEYHEMCVNRAKSSTPHLLTSLVPVE
ncbi:putative N6A methyltransferase [Synechococcus phage S-MbCM6]|mgnify:FL=1|jgi:DNA modification methylase|uniref:site-specific DNA-methyltransferase (cytosine-N(4)-specific) n=3 Tax=Namakavirus smbcm6 TaxID=2734120 RepID=H8ZMF1_9CAUD|nr:DNA methyltransferase [Synechococcus phage ACG-2014c]AHB80680.1 putative N6A methyltransferase [Synechococcus phage S-MbCM25]AFD02662.1 putative N6A methyltransferase [Synechococcus phage ACG-2014c]AIX14439.1 putative N6A methyltransferase [Synechococcus phage ACG-2014c]AIX22599.1 putative N6A methyltransferase [Synechococcus phage ACG-2014c]AIX22813.1 putative N6A methyltransferase [Synechococcus phage ACG-2014c]